MDPATEQRAVGRLGLFEAGEADGIRTETKRMIMAIDH